jgi:nicotinamidase-related amidase
MSDSRITASDSIILFADLQEGIADLPLTVSAERLGKGVRGLAKLAKLFEIPVIVTAVAGAEGEVPTHFRTTADSFLNQDILKAVKDSGRKTILISGVATELAVQLPALTGVDLGYRTFIVVDACGGVNTRTEEAAINRVTANGGSTVSVITLAGELAGDFSEPKAQAAVGIIFEMATAGN